MNLLLMGYQVIRRENVFALGDIVDIPEEKLAQTGMNDD